MKTRNKLLLLLTMLLVVVTILGGCQNSAEKEKSYIGGSIVYGTYEQDNNAANGAEPIEWLVLDQVEDRLLVISRCALDTVPYNDTQKSITWEFCTLRKWLNNEFLNTAFTSAEQEKILALVVPADENPKSEVDPGRPTRDKVFILSIAEVQKYFPTDEARDSMPTAYAIAKGAYESLMSGTSWWWLRTPGQYSEYVAYIKGSGTIDVAGKVSTYDRFAVRPVMWIEIPETME